MLKNDTVVSPGRILAEVQPSLSQKRRFSRSTALQPTASLGGSPCLLQCRLAPFFLSAQRWFFAVAAIPAARSFAIRLMSFTGTGLVNGKWTVPFRNS